jgi:hypothetical protein
LFTKPTKTVFYFLSSIHHEDERRAFRMEIKTSENSMLSFEPIEEFEEVDKAIWSLSQASQSIVGQPTTARLIRLARQRVNTTHW